MTECVFIEYLSWIRSIVKESKIFLVIDQYGPHIGPHSEAKASRNNIKFIPVPKGGTAIYQPLDKGIYGIMKRKGTALWTRKCHQNPKQKWDKEISAGMALECWGAITEDHILAAWNSGNQMSSSESTTISSDDDFNPEIREQ